MKITDVRWTPCFIPIEAPLRYAFGSHPGFSRIIVEVETNEGIVGLGECYGGASREGQLAEMKPLLIGEDPFQLERIRWKLAAPTSLKLFGHTLGWAALEFACLDIQGKALNKPICDIIGGRVREVVPFSAYLFYRYANDRGEGEVSNVEQMVGFAKYLVKQYGFQTLKYKNGVLPPDEEIETFVTLRDKFPASKIRLDPNAAWSVTTAVRVARKLHEYDVEYLEDPVWGMRAMARVNEKAPWVTLASNMSVFAFEDLVPTTMMKILDVVLIDPHWYGGITRARLAAQICETMGIDVGMHSGAEFGISQAAMIHLAASVPNMTVAPDSHYHHLTDDILEGGKLQYGPGGTMKVPAGPGLGVSLDRDKIARYHELSRKKEMGSWIEDPRRPGVITTQPKW
ncbi:MAG TPA: enolase C-terminal domain-like protein [Terriglobales bacterium]|nr:enolase C-terminal domain-like protein [Terriglobales bacterium]